MAYVINDECISCGAYVSGCPVEAISEGASHVKSTLDVCVDCGACASVCPVRLKSTVDCIIQLIFSCVHTEKSTTLNAL